MAHLSIVRPTCQFPLLPSPLRLLLINCQSSLNVREAAGKYITLTLLCDVQIHWKAWLYKEEAQKKERI